MKANQTLQLPPIVKTIDVACSQERAFTAFTSKIHAWWPLATHSLSEGGAAFCAIEPRLGGRVFERDLSGCEHLWGTVVAWDPPRSMRFTWRVGRAANSQQEVEVRFEPHGERTRITLTHSGFEQDENRRNYDGGWDYVLSRFVEQAHAAVGT